MPLPTKIYAERTKICQTCEWFHKNRCRKGHQFLSSTGCPVRKFPPINAAGYDPDVDPQPLEQDMGICSKCVMKEDITWPEVLAQFAKAMVKWTKAGMPLVSAAVHGRRQSHCQTCPHRKGYWCSLCKCLIYLKTKVATEKCPAEPPRWL